jgi:hypothetical protein
MVMSEITELVGIAVLGATGAAIVTTIVLLDFKRYLTVAPTEDWMERSYRARLPNVLMQLYKEGYPSPWPKRRSVLSAILFQRRLKATLRNTCPQYKKFVRQHMGLWAFLQGNASELQMSVRLAQAYLARKYLQQTPDSNHRLRVVAFLKQNNFPADLAEKKTLLGLSLERGHEALSSLRKMDVLMREHGFHVSPELACLFRWESAYGAELIEELRAAEV